MSLKNNKTILIVEDEVPMIKALVDKFRREGFAVLEAGDGEDGLKIAMEKRPDLILLDIVMPKMDGMDMMKRGMKAEFAASCY